MKIKLSINTNIIDKGNPAAHGWLNAELSVAELIKHIQQGFAFSPAVINPDAIGGTKPKADDVDYAQLLAIDIDNDFYDTTEKKTRKKTDKENYLTFDKVKNNIWMQNHALFAYTTASHTEEHHKFRIVFLLPEPIADPDEYKKIAKAIIERLGGDMHCSNIDRLFYGNRNATVAKFALKELQYMSHEEIQKSLNFKKDLKESHKDSKKFDKKLSAKDITEIISYVPTQMPYNDWSNVLAAVGNYFEDDLETARKIIDAWSPDQDKGTMYKLKHRKKTIKIGTLIYHAKHNGCDISQFYAAKSKYIVDENGEIKKGSASINNIENFLDQSYEFRYNVIKGIVEFKKFDDQYFQQLTDRDENSIWIEIQKAGIETSPDKLTRVLNSNYIPEYHPFKDYFDSLPDWNGIDYIEKFIQAVKVQKGQEDIWNMYFQRWLMALVATAIEYPRKDGNGYATNHTCIVFVGEQGIGKTTLVNKLVPEELTKYYAVTQIDADKADSKILVAENFLINLDELEYSTRDELASLKSLFTIEQITVRRPYGRRNEVMLRHASFIGSVNRSLFLTDATGSRRFLTVDVEDINLDVEIDVDQLYAQTLHLLRLGCKYWFDGEDIVRINDHNTAYEIISPEEEMLTKMFEPVDVSYYSNDEIEARIGAGILYAMTATEILNVLQAKAEVKLFPRSMGILLRKLGFQQRLVKRDRIVKRTYFLQEMKQENGHSF